MLGRLNSKLFLIAIAVVAIFIVSHCITASKKIEKLFIKIEKLLSVRALDSLGSGERKLRSKLFSIAIVIWL